jgi:hypothetical protein
MIVITRRASYGGKSNEIIAGADNPSTVRRKLTISLAFVCLLGLVAKPVWQAREQWQFGQASDDGIYWLTAKALAQGQGYRVISLPEQPIAIKYPPLYPLYLSLAWRLNPVFPDNLRVAALLQMLLLPVWIALMLAVLRQLGVSWRRAFLVAAFTLVMLSMVGVTITLLSELLCFCFLFAAMLAIQRSVEVEETSVAAALALAAGSLVGLAYLARTAVLPMLLAAPAFYLLRKRLRLGVFFLASALPVAGSWQWWTFAHPAPGPDPTNASYLSEYARMIGVHGLQSNVLHQLASLSAAAAENFLPGLMRFLLGLPLYHVVLAAAIAGCIRMGRRRNWPVYFLFSAWYIVMLLFWWYQGLSRLILPVWPLLLAGIAEEASHVARLCKNAMARSSFWSSKPLWWRQMPRWALIAIGLVIIAGNGRFCWRWVDSAIAEERRLRIQDQSAFSWIASNVSEDTLVLAWKDTTIHLYTGAPTSRGLFLAVTPQTPELKAVASSFSMLPATYRRALLVLLRSDLGDGYRDLDPLRTVAESIAGSKLEFSSPGALIYRFDIPRQSVATARPEPR